MSYAKELLDARRSDAFLITEDTSPAQLAAMDLRLVQSFKRTGSSIEVRFVDIAKLCELADRAELAERAAGSEGALARLRELAGICADADEDEEAADMCAE